MIYGTSSESRLYHMTWSKFEKVITWSKILLQKQKHVAKRKKYIVNEETFVSKEEEFI